MAGCYWQQAALQPRDILPTSSVDAVGSFLAVGFGVTILSDMGYRLLSVEGKRIERRNVFADIPIMVIDVA